MIQIIVFLYSGNRGIEGLRDYESKVIPILREHGGILLSASSSSQKIDSDPDEIHIIQFPTAENFTSYRNDVRIKSLIEDRQEFVSHMELHITNEFHEYP